MERWMPGGDLDVARVGYGAMKLTGRPRGERPDGETALAVLRFQPITAGRIPPGGRHRPPAARTRG
ncbi:hypothetical protein [Nonomuraea sp. NPDC052265]|uniref:hypothetical protein n=1 Tax=Nonomuraea sp. NPDC052265 TaxID=3364374 RepID=UPI0037CC3340